MYISSFFYYIRKRGVNEMKKKLFYSQLCGAVFVILFGSLSHFFFEWSGGNIVVGLFCPVNESSWEHLKMLFFPMLLFGMLEYFWLGKEYCNYWIAQAVGIILGLISVLVLFYTYSGILGRNIMAADIAVFVISIILGFWVSFLMLRKGCCAGKGWKILGVILLAVLLLCFLLFTFYPPQLHLFWDSERETEGIQIF